MIVAAHARAQPPGDELLARVKLEPPRTWNAYEDLPRLTGGTAAHRTDADGKYLGDYTTRVGMRADACLFVSGLEPSDGAPEKMAMVANPTYQFELADKGGKGWVMKKYTLRKTMGDQPDSTKSVLDNIRLVSLNWLYLEGEYLPKLWNSPDFHTVSARSVTGSDSARVEVEFAYRPPKSKSGSRPMRGKLTFADDVKWIIVKQEVDIDFPDGAVHQEKRYYFRDTSGFPLIERTEAVRGAPNAKHVTQAVVQYDLQKDVDVPLADFTLSAFGFEEPPGVTWERPTPWYLYFAASVALFLTATALFAWLSRRHRAARAETPNPA